MTSRSDAPAFRILWRTFLDQFAANESATSDLQMRRAILGIIAFLITPGIYIMMSALGSFEILRLVAKARHMPELVETRLAQMAVVFVSYSMITTGLVTAFIWDTLVFDKRDAMVLGPMPVRGTTVVGAKLAALATFLIGAALAVNLTSGVPFGLVTGGNDGLVVRHTASHFAGTVGGAVFVFCVLVVARGLLVLLVSPQFAATAGTLLQFVFLSGVLCFMMVPTAMGETTPVFLDDSAGEWMPMAWFFGLFETIRGSREPGLDTLAARAIVALPLSMSAAVLVTVAGYRKQMRAALAPAARVAASAMLRRRLAGLFTGRDQIARGTSDFILTTLARSRPQQVPIAIAASMAVAIISIALSTRPGGIDMLYQPRTVVLWIPIVIAYWIIVGLRASFAMPTELPAAWAFRVHSRLPAFGPAQPVSNDRTQSMSYWSGVRAAMASFALVPALIANTLVVLPLAGWRVAAWHTLFVIIAVVMAAQAASITIDSVPFTRAYPPGHTKLRTRWPLYILGMYAIAYFPVQAELRLLNDTAALLALAAAGLLAIAALELTGRRAARRWALQPEVEVGDDPESLTFLNLGPEAGHHEQPAT